MRRAAPFGQILPNALLRARQALDERVRDGAIRLAPQGPRRLPPADRGRLQSVSSRPVGAVAGAPNAVVISETAWAPIGPAPIDSGLGSGAGGAFVLGHNPTSGRVSALAVNPSDPTGNTVSFGAVSGGVWKTTNGRRRVGGRD